MYEYQGGEVAAHQTANLRLWGGISPENFANLGLEQMVATTFLTLLKWLNRCNAICCGDFIGIFVGESKNWGSCQTLPDMGGNGEATTNTRKVMSPTGFDQWPLSH